MNEANILKQLESMVASGRVTEDEAARVRAAKGSADFDKVMGAIRARHAGGHMDSAIASGDMTRDEADSLLGQLRAGQHPKGLRRRLLGHRRRHDQVPPPD